MKTVATLLVTAAVFGSLGTLKPIHRAKILGISVQTQETPQFRSSGPRGKTVKPRHWLEITAEVEVETTDPSGFIPELEAQWFAVIMDKYRKRPVRLLGSAEFKNVRAIDQKVFLTAYIEPDTIERLTGKTRLTDNDIEGLALTLSGPGITREGRHGAGLVMATAEKDANWWTNWKHESLAGLIVPKSQTPFAPLWTDQFPTERIR